MREKEKALLLALVASLSFLCGCTKKANTIETEDGTYIEQNGEYVRLKLEPVTYEPGTHVISYNQYLAADDISSTSNGWEYSKVSIPEVPEGYTYVETIVSDNGSGRIKSLIHVYVNTKTVEVTPIFNTNKGMIDYCMPGVVVEEKVLELGD